MRFSYENRNELNNISLIDTAFKGFQYSYEKREVSFSCTDQVLRIHHEFVFQNVVYFEMQSASFWNGGYNIYYCGLIESPPQLEHLYSIQQAHPNLYDHSALAEGTSFVSMELQLNSGDTMLIIFEAVEYTQKQF